MTTHTTQMSRHLNAARAAVYRVLIDAEAVAAWRVPNDMSSHIHEFQPHVGGKFRVSLTYYEPTNTGKTNTHTDTYYGHFVDLVPNERVVQVMAFETDNPLMQGEMTLSFVLQDVEGGTEIRVTHEDVPSGIAPADNEMGWRMALDNLTAYLETEKLSNV
ncbi:MAG: SRPBCC domain-containing protein [Deinococcota bacterium]